MCTWSAVGVMMYIYFSSYLYFTVWLLLGWRDDLPTRGVVTCTKVLEGKRLQESAATGLSERRKTGADVVLSRTDLECFLTSPVYCEGEHPGICTCPRHQCQNRACSLWWEFSLVWMCRWLSSHQMIKWVMSFLYARLFHSHTHATVCVSPLSVYLKSDL